MAGLLEKIFLGYVNEQGEVDQEGYDDATKSGLTKVTTENKSVSWFNFACACPYPCACLR